MPMWAKIVLAVTMLIYIIMLIPRAKQILEESQKATERDWLGFLIPIGLVILFVFLLISMT